MDLLIDRAVARRRARAAMEYAGLGWKELAQKSGLSQDTVRRIISPTHPRGFHTREEWEAIADACAVPRWFLAQGFNGTAKADAEEDGGLRAQITELRAVVDGLAFDSLRHTRELQALRDRDRQGGYQGAGDQE